MEVLTRAAPLGLFDPEPAILRRIEGAGEAYFAAEWDGDQLKIGRRVDDQDW
jgi:hypothetical protein